VVVVVAAAAAVIIYKDNHTGTGYILQTVLM